MWPIRVGNGLWRHNANQTFSNKWRHNTISFHLAVMAGLAPEGSQFDGRQYDSKMNEL